jgi:hypothetical protein
MAGRRTMGSCQRMPSSGSSWLRISRSACPLRCRSYWTAIRRETSMAEKKRREIPKRLRRNSTPPLSDTRKERMLSASRIRALSANIQIGLQSMTCSSSSSTRTSWRSSSTRCHAPRRCRGWTRTPRTPTSFSS